MDSIEIDYNDYLADCAKSIQGVSDWIVHSWENWPILELYQNIVKGIDLNHPKFLDDKICLKKPIYFTLQNEEAHVELYDIVYETEPQLDIDADVEGRLTTLFMITTIAMNAKLNGKMRIRSLAKAPIETEFKWHIEHVKMKMIVGMKIKKDSFVFNNVLFEFCDVDMSLLYHKDSQMVSVFAQIPDKEKKTLLQHYLLNNIMGELGSAIKHYQLSRLRIKPLVSELCGNDYSLVTSLRNHNEKVHKCFDLLAIKIILILNGIMPEQGPTWELSGLSTKENGDQILKSYTGFVHELRCHKVLKKNVIICADDDDVVLYVPIFFEFRYQIYPTDETTALESKFDESNLYTTDGSYFAMKARKLYSGETKYELQYFKAVQIKPSIDHESKVNLTMDHIIIGAFEKFVEENLTEAVKFYNDGKVLPDDPSFSPSSSSSSIYSYSSDSYFECEDSEFDD